MIKTARNEYKGKRCFIIGSGPSLKSVDLLLLKDEITICVNESYKAMPFEPSFICVGDYKLWGFVNADYAQMTDTGVIVTTGLDGTCGSDYAGDNMVARVPLDKTRDVETHGFEFDLENKPVNKGWNVMAETVLPWVCYAGFAECILLGCDFRENGYSFDAPARGTENQKIDPRIHATFGRIAIDSPTHIINASKGTAVTAFPRVALDTILHRKTRDTSKYIVVGFYTPHQDYNALAERMKASVETQGIECHIFERASEHTRIDSRNIPMPWVANCAQCAAFCLEMYYQFPDRNILYLDADATMDQFPELLYSDKLDFDIAAPVLTNAWVKGELQSNTIAITHTTEAEVVLLRWCDETDRRLAKMRAGEYVTPYHEAWDQKILQDVIAQSNAVFCTLPREYGKITRPPGGPEIMEGVNPEDIVISQHQASRQNKRKVGT